MGRPKRRGGASHPGGFAGIPRIVLESPDFRGLSHPAKTLLLVLAYKYRGKNNGDLSASFTQMRTWGFGSKTTLAKALTELLRANLIVRTREGRFCNPGGHCALYALTWLPINECPGKRIEVAPTITPPRKFSFQQNA